MESRRFFNWLPAVLWLSALYGWHRWGLPAMFPSVASLQWSHGLGFSAFCVLLMGALARTLPRVQLPVLRLLTVVVGAGAAALEIGLLGLPGMLFFPLWAAALIGVSAVSLAARLLPGPFLRRWLNLEKPE